MNYQFCLYGLIDQSVEWIDRMNDLLYHVGLFTKNVEFLWYSEIHNTGTETTW